MKIVELSEERFSSIYIMERLSSSSKFFIEDECEDSLFILRIDTKLYEVYVNFEIYNASFNQWINRYARDIVDIYFTGLNEKDRIQLKGVCKDKKIEYIDRRKVE